VDIISIGTLSRNRLWNEQEQLRTAHATTSLIRAGDRNILIDPGLPPPALRARLFERTGLAPEKIDTIFLTNFREAHRSGLSLFPKAKVLAHEIELQSCAQRLKRLIDEAPEQDEDRQYFMKELELLETLTPAPDELAAGISIFPLFGYTAGQCGLLVAAPTTTTLIAGDAVPTLDHFLAGQVLPDASNIDQAQESMREVYEIADLVVPGHDNIFVNPRMSGM
jgi:glyoxylase-like metal-dependent hydrolase (beta-lactamase superfamily II)